MRSKITKKRLVAGGVVVGALAVAGLVFAAWTTNGSGQGYAKAGSAQSLSTVDVSASTTATLYPGTNGDVQIKISNPNPYPVKVTDVTGNGTITADASHPVCGQDAGHPTGVTFTNQTGLNISVPAQSGGTNGQATATLTNAASMANSSDNACQGATFTVPVSIAGVSNA